jgi:hypothetical protein
MGGKFRVKAEEGAQLEAPPVLRRNRRRINQPPRFHHPKEPFQSVRNSFLLGRLVATPDNELS